MNTRTIRRGLTVAAFGAATVLAMPGTAFAVEAPEVQIQTGVNTATFTITAPTGSVSCVGPWIHTKADADNILKSPTLDVANNPRNFFVGAPVSPVGGGGSGSTNRNPDGSENYVFPANGDTATAKIPYIADGTYVAGALCLTSEEGQLVYALTQAPFTIGNPAPATGGWRGNFGSLSFGS
ncbi:hypothetical protein [Rhodococcus sp. SGAir0479]|uniref:hypothetical protein n=1 Tax=Rhodococcus sp. SGAir0479 TaxID=2567884 RepID=UPI0010CCFA42|nr:hypothetical protein [Rhodococcus sp. SGAir0479]QCQ90210.1 hypothetical protein E7742_02585 [Rhodococcus sp. SGAir0479]